MRWPWQRAEARASYTDLAIASRETYAAGNGTADALAALEAAAGIVGRAFAAARVEGDRARLVHPGALETIGRELVRSGECLLIVDGRPPALRAASTSDIRGGSPDPETWLYRVDLATPDGLRTLTLPAEAVVHVRVNTHPSTPWRGRPAHRIASATSATASAAEAGVQAELKLPRGRILPSSGTNTQLAEIAGEIKRGGLTVVGSGSDLNMSARQDSSNAWKPQRLGPEMGDVDLALRSEAARDVLSAIGVPSVLLDNRADGTARREAFRQLLHLTIQPWGQLVEAELSAKLGAPVRLDFRRLAAADIATKARAFGVLVKGGLDVDRALSLAGLGEAS